MVELPEKVTVVVAVTEPAATDRVSVSWLLVLGVSEGKRTTSSTQARREWEPAVAGHRPSVRGAGPLLADSVTWEPGRRPPL